MLVIKKNKSNFYLALMYQIKYLTLKGEDFLYNQVIRKHLIYQ